MLLEVRDCLPWWYDVQKREAKACLEAAGKMLKVHAAGRVPLNRKEDEIYKVNCNYLAAALCTHGNIYLSGHSIFAVQASDSTLNPKP